MKSTKLQIGFLLAVLTAVILAGCKPITKSDLQKEFGLPDREQRKASLVESMKKSAWNSFSKKWGDMSNPGISFSDLQASDFTATTIKAEVEKWNKNEEKKNKVKGKFDETVTLYAQLTYKGSGEKKSNYAKKTEEEANAAFSQQFDITIVGDIETYLDKYGR
ncbi:MAG: hypothetical protein ACTTI6_05490 [Treponema sp.]|uniref:hypothetical protein n=1 Tax=Treponema sp. TaxID=166 RepID=UPI003FA31386